MTTLNFNDILTDGQSVIFNLLRSNISKDVCNLITGRNPIELRKHVGYPIIEVGEFNLPSGKDTRYQSRLKTSIECEVIVHSRTEAEIRTLSNKVLDILVHQNDVISIDYGLYDFQFSLFHNIPEIVNDQRYHSATITFRFEWQSKTNTTTANGVIL